MNLLKVRLQFLCSKGNLCAYQAARKITVWLPRHRGSTTINPLRVEFSDLREHGFKHNFQCSSPMCFCQTGIENNEHFFLHCPHHSRYLRDLLDCISNVVDVDPDNLSSTDRCNLLLDGNSCFSVETNHHIIESTISFIKSTSRFKRI